MLEMLSSRNQRGYLQRGLTLPVLVGVMLSLFALQGIAQTSEVEAVAAVAPSAEESVAVVEPKAESSHFQWFAHAELDANYIWRGLYCGGLSFQTEAEVSYYGFFANMWWNVGLDSWNWIKGGSVPGQPWASVVPEVDVSLGYKWRGLTLLFIHMYYFDRYADGRMSRYFDWRNYPPGGGGVTNEWRIAYRISDKVPLRLMWCTRTFGRDGYEDENGKLKRAYSTYIEARYDQPLPYDFTLSGVLGITPWRSLYTGFKKEFAVVNLAVSTTKSWKVAEYCSVQVGAMFAFNPSSLQPLWNITAGVTFD